MSVGHVKPDAAYAVAERLLPDFIAAVSVAVTRNHMESEKQWLNELNEYTNYKYSDIICLRLSKYFLYYYLIYKDGLAEKNLLTVLPGLKGRSKAIISCVYWAAKHSSERFRRLLVSMYRISKYR